MEELDFNKRFERYKTVQAMKLKRALRVMKAGTREILSLVPLLLHYNDPHLPGYRKNEVPYGIDCFTPDKSQKNWLKRQGVTHFEVNKGACSILGLYAMGSTSSIGQGASSDLDIWVCVGRQLPERLVSLLIEKCRFISNFAKTLGADINLFVTAEDRFIVGQHGTLDTEDCGSAQSLFLLDEFYRTAVYLCGRYLIWYMVPAAEEIKNYKNAANSLKERGLVDDERWFDLGSAASSSPAEYFGSGLWFLYKGIDNPFKAAIKILLMEAYSHEYPATRLLSLELKKAMYFSSAFALRHDAYFMMYKKAERYLTLKQDKPRRDLIRLCFFLKLRQALEGLTDGSELAYRKRLIRHLLAFWRWKQSYAESLTSIENWKVGFVRRFHGQLFDSLLQSYRALLNFSIGHGIEDAITSDDAGILSRKLYVFFDKYPGKIELIGKEFRPFLEEPCLTFVKSSKGSLCKSGWYIYPAADSSIDLMRTQTIYISKEAAKAVAWATFNKIMTSRTKIKVCGSASLLDPAKIVRFSEDLRSFFKNLPTAVIESDLQKNIKIVRCMVILNFDRDAIERYQVPQEELEAGSALSCGRHKLCLIGSIGVISADSWGQMQFTRMPDGENGIVELIAFMIKILPLSEQGGQKLFSYLKISSYSKSYSDLIRYDLESVLRQVFACRQKINGQCYFDVGRNSYLAKQSKDMGVVISRRSMFRSSEFDTRVLSSFGMRPEFVLQVPPQIDRMAMIGIMQYFFVQKQGSLRIYVVNERNEVKIYNDYQGSKTELVNAINRSYTSQSEESNHSGMLHFNLPQYFVLNEDRGEIQPFVSES